MKRFRPLAMVAISLALVLSWTTSARAFCGFYVSQANASLYNQASQVILARDDDRTVVTMANDFQGEADDFAMVVPVPVVLQPGQVHVGDPEIVKRLDSFSAPRLVEYFDENPCMLREELREFESAISLDVAPASPARQRANSLGITIESEFSVGEYDILVLSAKESSGLETWLTENGYTIPDNAQPLLQPYIRQGMKFFVAKVNLAEHAKSGYQYLRPLQIAYESPKFMLPIRLGMTNARGEQDLLIYALSPRGQVELTNYRTVKIPTDAEIPVYVKDRFEEFYTSTFDTARDRANKNVAFLEYAWDMSSCDPCAAPVLTPEELRKAGVFWTQANPFDSRANSFALPPSVFLTRLHVRYDRANFPEDLVFQETANREFFQGRYILRHPFQGETPCRAGQEYRKRLPERFEREAQALAKLTNWDIADIRKNLPSVAQLNEPRPWWDVLLWEN
ncbi:MAG: DUF2330 domain-containing protein [Cyanobacteria bacterium P01_F01_bin.33]